MTWHLLQVSDVLDEEFGAALAERVPLLAWEPRRTALPWGSETDSPPRRSTHSGLQIHSFPLMRGYARFPVSLIARTAKRVCRTLLEHTEDPAATPLICTIPYFAGVAECWPGPVVYWLTDRMERYEGADPGTVHALDRRMCRAAALVCPNSNRLAEYLMEWGACPVEKIRVLPNATRAANVFPAPPEGPATLPDDLADLSRPVVGVIGNFAGNMDWALLEGLIRGTPEVHWAMVGPHAMAIPDPTESAARNRVLSLPNARFTGRKPYGDLAAYARAFDVAVLPYRRCEPTYSGSSTRFYEHLAACRPMLATRGFEELLHKEPLLKLFDTAEQGTELLEALLQRGSSDGFERLRWEQSREGTWQARAATLLTEVELLLAQQHGSSSADRQQLVHQPGKQR